ncbi:hypothetical protein HAX54_016795 [Datura stramonium]|uniref:Uncharacterized protein n=1 Tax=Datura stramonium TaxID=4076 RepID=A0ABS8UJM2_DATST|nr:hypothetical protein [Datura stramonium]
MEEEKGVILKENATKWKQLAKEAVDEGGSSDKNIEEFLKLDSASIKIESIPHDEFPPDPDLLEWLRVLMSNNLTQIVEKLSDSEYPVKVLLFDSTTTWAIDLAHQLGLKGAAFFTQSCSLSAIYYHMDPEKSKIPLDGSDVSLPSLPLLEKDDLPSFVYETCLSLLQDSLSQNINFEGADWLFFNTFDALEMEVIDWLRTRYTIKTIGPTVPSMYLDKRLKDDKEYGSSLFKPNSETSRCVGTSSNWMFLYSLWMEFNSGSTEFRSTTIGMPQWTDQPTNAKFISDVWQTGVRVKARENGVIITRKEIASSIREVMEEEKGVMLKENATNGKITKEAVDEGGSSDKNIEEFLSNL